MGPYDGPSTRPWLLISESSERSLISERRLKKQLRVLTYVSIRCSIDPNSHHQWGFCQISDPGQSTVHYHSVYQSSPIPPLNFPK